MIRLLVWVTFPDGERVLAGTMVCGERPGGFRYEPSFVSRPRAFALDPVSLPLGLNTLSIDRPDGVASVFEDALPDSWGRRLLIRRAHLPRRQQTVPHLLQALGRMGIGALSFSDVGEPAPPEPLPGCVDIHRLLEAAEKVESGFPVEDEELSLLLNAGSSAGGARPKALVLDQGHPAIVKFPSRNDTLPIVLLEAATMALAGRAGIETPLIRVERCGGKHVLMVRRFDVTPEGGRRHMLSFQTLLRADSWYNLGYEDLLAMLRRESAQPEIDVPALYRQAVFNAVVGNTDDHLKNFTLLHDHRGFFLSPAYDLLPNIRGDVEHVLHYALSHVCPSRTGLVTLGKRAGVKSPANIVAEVFQAASHFLEEMLAVGVPEDVAARFWGGVAATINSSG